MSLKSILIHTARALCPETFKLTYSVTGTRISDSTRTARVFDAAGFVASTAGAACTGSAAGMGWPSKCLAGGQLAIMWPGR